MRSYAHHARRTLSRARTRAERPRRGCTRRACATRDAFRAVAVRAPRAAVAPRAPWSREARAGRSDASVSDASRRSSVECRKERAGEEQPITTGVKSPPSRDCARRANGVTGPWEPASPGLLAGRRARRSRRGTPRARRRGRSRRSGRLARAPTGSWPPAGEERTNSLRIDGRAT